MAKTQSPLKDEDILTKVLAKSQSSTSWFDSKLSRERERVTRYINGSLPERIHKGSSTYVSSDVYDSVMMQHSQLLEVFASDDHIATFDPDQDMNTDMCRVATQYASYVIFRENPGYQLFSSTIYDGLTARAGVVKVYWEEKATTREERFDGVSYEDAHALASQEDVDEFEADFDEQTGTFGGTLIRKTDCSKVTIDQMAPEQFLIEPLATSIEDATYCGHRVPKTKADLVAMGYKKSIVMGIPDDDAKTLQFSPEVLARTMPQMQQDSTDEPVQEELGYVVYYESYIRMQIDPAKGVRLYKICHAGSTILDKQEVDKAPFLAYVPLPIPHVFYGDNFAARVIPTQNARTVLFRGVLDHTAITTNPRYMVVNGGLMNPREMLDNRIGGLVNVRRPDSVTAFPQNTLNPYVFNTLQLLTDNNEKSTGISSLSQGLNKDAISTQNSQGLVDNMMKASGQRGKIMARNFAYGFLVPLMIEVIRLAILNEKKQKVIEVAGGPLTISPQDWSERKTCTVSMHLGYGEKDIAVAKLGKAYETMAKDQGLGNMFGPQQRYAMWHDMAKLSGMNGFNTYLDPKAPPPQPDPLKVQEVQAKVTSSQASMVQAQSAAQKDQRLAAMDQGKLDLQQRDQMVKALDHDRTHDRQDLETVARIHQGQEQLGIEHQLAANDAAKVRISASAPKV